MESKKPFLVVFTNRSSLINGREWFFNEMKILSNSFDLVIYCYDLEQEIFQDGFKINKVVKEKKVIQKKIVNYIFPIILEFFTKKVFLKKYWLKSWITLVKQIIYLTIRSWLE